LENILAAASGNDSSLSPDVRELVEHLRNDRKLWWSLHNVYQKIIDENLVGTCPLVIAKPRLVDKMLPLGKRLHGFQEFHKLFHESIHYVLEANDIRFDDCEFEEGVVTYMHEKVMGKKTCAWHYTGTEGSRYLHNAQVIGKILDAYPNNAVVPLLAKLHPDLKAQ